MNKTKIEYCDSTYNPVTGCKHGCKYCYAADIVKRFGGYAPQISQMHKAKPCNGLFEISVPIMKTTSAGKDIKAPFPFMFAPTLHRYRLDDYKTKKGRTIFVGSMTDLFGDWVPDEWIKEVFKACEAAPQHRYLFLTKNPNRYRTLNANGVLPIYKNFWYGTTITDDTMPMWFSVNHNTFLSIEPLITEIKLCKALGNGNINWVIIGAETGKRKSKIIPKRDWIESIVKQCRSANVPVFMKSSLTDIWGEPLIQEYPWQRR